MPKHQGFKVTNMGCSFELYNSAAVRYTPPGVWRHALLGCGPLTVFADLLSAKSFIHGCKGTRSEDYQIWLCDYVSPVSKTRRAVWAADRVGVRLLHKYLPPGTVLTEKVRLVSVVED